MLRELDEQLVQFWTTNLSNLNRAYNESNVLHSLVDDEATHRVQYEEKISTQITMPFAVVVRNAIRSNQYRNVNSSAVVINNVVVGSEREQALANTTSVSPVEIDYTLFMYDDKFERLSDTLEAWWLATGVSHTLFRFTMSDVADETMSASITLDEPSPVRPTRIDVQDAGLIYSESFPFVVHTYIVKALERTKVILYPSYHIILVNNATSFEKAKETHMENFHTENER